MKSKGKAHRTPGGKALAPSKVKQKKGTTKGTASRYMTRNLALNRLQLKLADFRWGGVRWCAQARPDPSLRAPQIQTSLVKRTTALSNRTPCLLSFARHYASAAVHPEGYPPARAEEEG